LQQGLFNFNEKIRIFFGLFQFLLPIGNNMLGMDTVPLGTLALGTGGGFISQFHSVGHS
jgi:hypothetical protein